MTIGKQIVYHLSRLIPIVPDSVDRGSSHPNSRYNFLELIKAFDKVDSVTSYCDTGFNHLSDVNNRRHFKNRTNILVKKADQEIVTDFET
jgi:hypothetical protein